MEDGLVGEEVRLEREHFGGRQRGRRGDGAEAAVSKFVGRLGHVAVGEAAVPPHGLQHEEDVVLLDELAEGRTGEALDMAPHVLRRVASGEEGCLSRRALREAVDAQTGVDRLRAVRDQVADEGADIRIHRVVRRGGCQSESIHKYENFPHSTYEG